MGLILPQTVLVKAHNYTRNFYTEKGYMVGKIGTEFIVDILDLPESSTQKVFVKCDFCGKVYEIEYRRFLTQKNNGTSCSNCRYNKVEKTNLAKYGHRCSLRNPDVLQKSKETSLKKIGVEYPFQSNDILKMCADTQIKKYGRVGRAVNTSKQQIQLHKIYGGKLNYHLYPYHIDILFEEESIALEYDGLGHNLLVKIGKLTQEEFDRKEKIRSNFILDSGYKLFRIIADKNDNLPNIEELKHIKDVAFKCLLEEDITTYIYNLKTNEREIF